MNWLVGCHHEASSAASIVYEITPDFTNCDILIVLKTCLKCSSMQAAVLMAILKTTCGLQSVSSN